jgi:neutral amino acid transport system ATP-binding protein|uniref:ABC transporter ATP-binding protein n=1 Tax=Candidatus Nanopelagicus sp. TaxID=2518620 RepID=UPI00404ACB0D
MQERNNNSTEFFLNVEMAPGSKKMDPILIADRVSRNFGGLTAVDVEHLEVQRGAITALIGPNGAGKTTFFNLLTGYDKPNHGEWSFNGKNLKDIPPYRVAKLGMVRTFQLTKALYRLTVIQNMALAAKDQKGESLLRSLFPFTWRRQEAEIYLRSEEILKKFKLIDKKDDFAAALSGGQRKLLELARALMVEPELIMLDEPMAGVNPALKQSLLEHIKDLRAQGKTVLFVEHDMDMVMEISDWVVVMAQGKIIAEGPPKSIINNQEVITAYLGAHHDAELDENSESMASKNLKGGVNQ